MTSPPPWLPDRELTAELASALIRCRFPSIESGTLRLLGSGWEFDAFLTEDGWVFRFPRRQGDEEAFARERIAHELVAPILSQEVAVPRVLLLGEPGLGFPYQFAGHRYIPGVSAQQVSPEVLPTLATDLAAALRAIHSVSAERARHAGVPDIDPGDAGRNEWLELGFAAARELRGIDPAVDQGLDWLARVRLPVPVPRAPHTLIHQDLAPEHLIVDAARGRLAGILDWTDTTIGDPARDFVFLVTWQGWQFAHAVARAYSPEPDVDFLSRLRFMSRLLSLMWLAMAYRAQSDLQPHVQGVRHVFGSEL